MAAVGFLARLAKLEARVGALEGRVGDVEGVQLEDAARAARVERSLKTVLVHVREQGAEFARFRNRTEKALRQAISAASTRSYRRQR